MCADVLKVIIQSSTYLPVFTAVTLTEIVIRDCFFLIRTGSYTIQRVGPLYIRS